MKLTTTERVAAGATIVFYAVAFTSALLGIWTYAPAAHRWDNTAILCLFAAIALTIVTIVLVVTAPPRVGDDDADV